MFSLYAILLLLQIVTAGSILEQGSLPLLILTCVHAGAVAAFFWCLVANALVATQVLFSLRDDSLPTRIIPSLWRTGRLAR